MMCASLSTKQKLVFGCSVVVIGVCVVFSWILTLPRDHIPFESALSERKFFTNATTTDTNLLNNLNNGNTVLEPNQLFLEAVRQSNTENCTKRKYLIYKCNGVCGGLCDRERSIVTTFVLSLVMNRTFGIDMAKPCKLETSLIPNMYDWTRYRSFKNEYGRIASTTTLHNAELLLNQLNSSYPTFNLDADIVYIQTNLQFLNEIRHCSIVSNLTFVSSWLRYMPNHEVIRHVYNALFKTTERLSNDMMTFTTGNKVGAKENKTLVCSHIRVGKNPSIPSDNFRPGNANISTIFEFLDKFNNFIKYKIYIATDSDIIKQEAKMRYRNFIYVDREIVHIDRVHGSVKDACEGLYTAIMEQTILTKCDVLLLTKSGFGEIAGCVRGHSNNLYMFKHNIIERIKLDFYKNSTLSRGFIT